MLRARVALPLIAIVLALGCTPETELNGEQPPADESPASKGGSDTVTGSSADPGAAILVEPPPGATNIPTNLARLLVRLTEAVQATGTVPPFELRAAESDVIALTLGAASDCSGLCYELVPTVPLAPSVAYTVAATSGGLQFLDGKPTPPGIAGSFATASSADPFAPRISAFTVVFAEGCLSAHVVADEPVRCEIALSAGADQAVLRHSVFASTSEFAERLSELPAGVAAQATLRIFDRAGNSSASAPISLQLPAQLPTLALTEILANPAGSETTQEFVEILNWGKEPQALGGLQLADKSGSDALSEVLLPAGAFAVVVSEGYLADGKDPAPREGAVVVHIGGRIGSDGLSNSGETVRLLTAQSDVISQYGGWVDVSASAWSGKSVKRSDASACDGANAWSKSPSLPTPGW